MTKLLAYKEQTGFGDINIVVTAWLLPENHPTEDTHKVTIKCSLNNKYISETKSYLLHQNKLSNVSYLTRVFSSSIERLTSKLLQREYQEVRKNNLIHSVYSMDVARSKDEILSKLGDYLESTDSEDIEAQARGEAVIDFWLWLVGGAPV